MARALAIAATTTAAATSTSSGSARRQRAARRRLALGGRLPRRRHGDKRHETLVGAASRLPSPRAHLRARASPNSALAFARSIGSAPSSVSTCGRASSGAVPFFGSGRQVFVAGGDSMSPAEFTSTVDTSHKLIDDETPPWRNHSLSSRASFVVARSAVATTPATSTTPGLRCSPCAVTPRRWRAAPRRPRRPLGAGSGSSCSAACSASPARPRRPSRPRAAAPTATTAAARSARRARRARKARATRLLQNRRADDDADDLTGRASGADGHLRRVRGVLRRARRRAQRWRRAGARARATPRRSPARAARGPWRGTPPAAATRARSPPRRRGCVCVVAGGVAWLARRRAGR